MKYFCLLFAGSLVSIVHSYLVCKHRKTNKYSISEFAVVTKQSHLIYFIAHAVCDVLVLLFAYQFFYLEQHLLIAFYLLVVFAFFDFLQAVFPSKGVTEKIHFAAAYVSWSCYLIAGVMALTHLDIMLPAKSISIAFLVPVIGMFIYMHFKRSKLYPFQLNMVPMYVASMLFVVIGAR